MAQILYEPQSQRSVTEPVPWRGISCSFKFSIHIVEVIISLPIRVQWVSRGQSSYTTTTRSTRMICISLFYHFHWCAYIFYVLGFPNIQNSSINCSLVTAPQSRRKLGLAQKFLPICLNVTVSLQMESQN
jgi:hypothetical protein